MSATVLRVFVALILLTVVGFSVMPYATSYVSTSAVVNAPLINISSPFDGVITTPTKGVSMPVKNGDTLITLENSRSQRGSLQNVKTTLGALSGEIVGMEKQTRDLTKLRTTLIARRDALVAARVAWFIPRLAEAKANVNRANINFLDAQRNAQRIEKLVMSGAVTRSNALDSEVDLSKAVAELASQQAAFDQLVVERDTLDGEMGVDLTSTGFEQIEYRLDEITIRLADIEARLLERYAQRAGIMTQINSMAIEATRQEVFSPYVTTSGIIWEASSGLGTTVVTGERVATVLDCSRRFLEVELPERNFENVPTGTLATVQLKGSSVKFSAKVLAAYGSGARPNNDMQAARERIVTRNGFRVIVGLGGVDVDDITAAGSFCDVGRTAEVRFDLAEDDIISRGIRLFEQLTGQDQISQAQPIKEDATPVKVN